MIEKAIEPEELEAFRQREAAVDIPQGAPVGPLTRARCIEMLANYANGTYQAISPDVCGRAASLLQNSTPNEEPKRFEPAVAAVRQGDGGSSI